MVKKSDWKQCSWIMINVTNDAGVNSSTNSEAVENFFKPMFFNLAVRIRKQNKKNKAPKFIKLHYVIY